MSLWDHGTECISNHSYQETALVFQLNLGVGGTIWRGLGFGEGRKLNLYQLTEAVSSK